jgi:hypothetical protein
MKINTNLDEIILMFGFVGIFVDFVLALMNTLRLSEVENAPASFTEWTNGQLTHQELMFLLVYSIIL